VENKNGNCFALVTHKYNDFVRQQWIKLKLELTDSSTKPFIMFDFSDKPSKEHDMALLIQDVNNGVISLEEMFLFDELVIRESVEKIGYDLEYYEDIPKKSPLYYKALEAYINLRLKQKGYNVNFKYRPPRPNLFYGNIMTAYMYFFLRHPDYDYYWFKEWDVEYTGSWRYLIEKYDKIDDDFISRTAFAGTEYKKKWFHYGQWKTNTIEKFKDSEVIVTFNPLTRFSHRALDYLDSLYRGGNSGFYELFLATVLRRGGYKLGGFKEYGDLDLDGFVYLPRGKCLDTSKIEIKSNKLYHPIKKHIDFRINA